MLMSSDMADVLNDMIDSLMPLMLIMIDERTMIELEI